MIFKQLSPSKMDAVDSNVRKVLKVMELSTPDYHPPVDDEQLDQRLETRSADTDLNVLGKLLFKSGAVVAATGLMVEVLPESADTVSHMTFASGLGAAAIGGAIVSYEKASQ